VLLEGIITAEIEKKKTDKQESHQIDEERAEKLRKLKELKQKLQEIESEEEKVKEIIDVKLLAAEQQTSIDDDLSDLENSISQEISETNLEDEEKKISSTLSKIAGVPNDVGEVTLTEADIASIDSEISKLEQEIKLEQAKAAVIVSIFDQLCEEYTWLKEPAYGFMYSMPDKKKNKKDFESWLDDWSKVLFDYAHISAKHVMYTKELLSEKPWSEFKDRTNVIQEVADSLVKQKVAEFLDKKKEKIRIYWKSLEAWADAIVDWAREIAFTEPIFMEDIREADQDFSSLPDDDITKIFNIINKKGLADKVKIDEKIAIQIKF
jgi:hypothetical protein